MGSGDDARDDARADVEGEAQAPRVPRVCFGAWRSEDGSRAMHIVATTDDDGREAIAVSVWRVADGGALMTRRPGKWRAPRVGAEASAYARERLGFVQVEVGLPGLGTTYDLMVARANPEPGTRGGYQWIRLAPETARADVRLFPEAGASYYEAVLGYWDDYVETLRDADAWMQPLSTWLPDEEV